MRRWSLVVGMTVMWLAVCAAPWLVSAQAQDPVPPADGSLPMSDDEGTVAAQTTPTILLLTPGQVETLEVATVARVVIGDPAIADVTVASPTSLLVQAKAPGATNLLVWDADGQRHLSITVIDPAPEALSREVSQLLQQMDMPLRVELRGGKVFLVGQVPSDEQFQAVEQMVTAFRNQVVNLVTVMSQPSPPPSMELPLVSLSVQIIDLNRSDLDRLGVSWSQSVALTESDLSASSLSDQLLRIGQTATRSSLLATLRALVQKNKARILAEPKLVTSSGKEASSFIGVEVPVISTTSTGTGSGTVSTSIEFRKTGVLLTMTPIVSTDRRITTSLTAEVSSIDTASGLSLPVGSQTILVPGFSVRKANTNVTTASGEAIVIAGLLQVEDSLAENRVPGLGGIPVVGRLFRSPETKSTHRELVITITPELLSDVAEESERRLALEQALAVAEVTASVSDPRLQYALKVQDRIAKALRYPAREKELEMDGAVKLRLHLFADGTLGRVVVAESSGIEALDMEALKVAESQAPYPSFPGQLIERELWIDVPVVFRP